MAFSSKPGEFFSEAIRNELIFIFSTPKVSSFSYGLEILREIVNIEFGFEKKEINFEDLEFHSDEYSFIYPLYRGKRIPIDENVETLFNIRYRSLLDTGKLWSSILLSSDLRILLYFDEKPGSLETLQIDIFQVGPDQTRYLFLAETISDDIYAEMQMYLDTFSSTIRLDTFLSKYTYRLALELLEYHGAKIYKNESLSYLTSFLQRKLYFIFYETEKEIDLGREIAQIGEIGLIDENLDPNLPWFIKYEILYQSHRRKRKQVRPLVSRDVILGFLEKNCFNMEDFISKEEFSSFSDEDLENIIALTKDNEILIPIYNDNEEPYFFPGVRSALTFGSDSEKVFCYDIVGLLKWGEPFDPILRKKIPYQTRLLLKYYPLIREGYIFPPENILFPIKSNISLNVFPQIDKIYQTVLYLGQDTIPIEGPDFDENDFSVHEIRENFLEKGFFFSSYFYQYFLKTGKYSQAEPYIYSSAIR